MNKDRGIVPFLLDSISVAAATQITLGVICGEPWLIGTGVATWFVGLPLLEGRRASNEKELSEPKTTKPQSNPPLGFQGPRA